jgi:superfamily II DNA or RNA helicase
VTEDIPIVAQHNMLLGNEYRWGDLALKGRGFDELLRLAMESGRIFFGNHPDGVNVRRRYYVPMKYERIVEGEAEDVEPIWEMTDKGEMRPSLKFRSGGMVIIPTIPLRYIKEESATMGMLSSVYGAEMLIAWKAGPVIATNYLKTVTDELLEGGTAQLPTPVLVETEMRDGDKAVAYFQVQKAEPSSMEFTGQKVIGRLRVRYGDSDFIIPIDQVNRGEFIEMREGKRVIWKRDYEVERRMVEKIFELGLVPVIGYAPPGYENPEWGQDYVICEDFDIYDDYDDLDLDDGFGMYELLSEKALWLRLLEGEECARLREEGWVIEVRENAGLRIHEIEDLFPAIEGDSDHGIDWFQFDIPHEINGKRVSLIPVIAEAIRRGLPSADDPNIPDTILIECEDEGDGMMRFPTKRLIEIVEQVRHLFHGSGSLDGAIRLDRLAAAGVADGLSIDGTETLRALAKLGKNLRNIRELPDVKLPKLVKANLRGYQQEGLRWLQFLSENGLHGILADDMGLGKTVQTLAHLAAEREKKPGRPSLVIAPTSVVPNWAAEAGKFVPDLKTVVLQGKDRAEHYSEVAKADLVVTSYPVLSQDFEILSEQNWHVMVLDEAQYIKNPKALTAQNACKLKAAHRICLSGTPLENHLGELWSLMRFLMPGYLADEKTFNMHLRRPIERDRSADAQIALNRRVAPLILRRTKNEVATDLPEKTEIIHGIDLNRKQLDLYESVRAAMDKRVREAISEKGLAKSHIIVLDALLKLRQICCHPKLLKIPAAQKIEDSAKLEFLTKELLPTLIEEGRRILLFSTFTSMLAIIEEHLKKAGVPYLKITGQTKEREPLVREFQRGEVPVFLISLKAGGTGLNLTAADTVIHYDPWWNPAAENQATDRAHRIGQTKPVFVHKLVCRGSIEERILELQKHKAGLVEALLTEETSKLRIDPETLGHLLAPIG